MHDGSSPVGRERSSSLQGMDMASLPPRKRPWQDGPGTGDPRERESPGSDGGETTPLAGGADMIDVQEIGFCVSCKNGEGIVVGFDWRSQQPIARESTST